MSGYQFNVILLSITKSIEFVIEDTKLHEEVINELLTVLTFNIVSKNNFVIRRNSNILQRNLERIVNKYKSALPKIQQLPSYFKLLNDNEFLVVFLEKNSSEQEVQLLLNYLYCKKKGLNFLKFQRNWNSQKFAFNNAYTYKAQDGKIKIPIGEKDKSKRKCRFCFKSKPQVSFKKIAHAIPESLGNKTIINYDECDSCNEKYGLTIEREFSNYFSLFRVLNKLKGKNGVPKLKGKDFELFVKDNKIHLEYNQDKLVSKSLDDNIFFLETYDKIVKQNIYRALCKFAISSIESRFLPHFRNTISWIDRDFDAIKLPKIAILNDSYFYDSQPKIGLFLRKNQDKTIPFCVAELGFGSLIFVFIVPRFLLDKELPFISAKEYKTYWNFFKHFSTHANWRFIDFSDTNESKVNFTLNLKGKSPPKNN